jgi:hypothetical protein
VPSSSSRRGQAEAATGPWRRPDRLGLQAAEEPNGSHGEHNGGATVPFCGGEWRGAHRRRPVAEEFDRRQKWQWWRCSSERWGWYLREKQWGKVKAGAAKKNLEENEGEWVSPVTYAEEEWGRR